MRKARVTEYVLEYLDEYQDIQDVLHFNTEAEARRFRDYEFDSEDYSWKGDIWLSRVTYRVTVDQNNQIIDEFEREYEYLT